MNETERALLDALREGPVAGPELAARLDVSRTAIWKAVESLREAGFGIESTDDGYAVTDVPAYGGPAIAFGLAAPFAVEFHDSVPTTNGHARELAAEGAEDVVVVADEQTAGRGRLDREWASPSGGAWLSLVLRPDRPPAHAPLYTLAAAVAVARAAREAGVDARIKWPNDVVVPREDALAAKLAGILTEMEGEADRVAWLVVGIGINANLDPEELPAGATSLRAETGEGVRRRLFVQRLLEEFDALRTDPDAILPAWRDLTTTLGREVRVETPGGTVEGVAEDVVFPGSLVVRTDDGEVRVHAGDCEHLRPG